MGGALVQESNRPWSPSTRRQEGVLPVEARAVRSALLPILISLGVLAADYLTDPLIHLSILFIVPIGMASWFRGRRWGIGLALSLPLLHRAISLVGPVPWSLDVGLINTAVQLAVLALSVYVVDWAAKRRPVDEVSTLRGLLPICSFCKRIRNAEGCWEAVEKYLADHSEAEFTHGICARCAREHYHVDVEECPGPEPQATVAR